jgi:23S rRNA (adenine2503-C2)-methyltransferase
VNLINYHQIPGASYSPSEESTMIKFRDALNDKGIISTIRISRGEDISAACGMLSTKELNKK